MQHQNFSPPTQPVIAFIEALDNSYEDIKDEEEWDNLAQRMDFRAFSDKIDPTLIRHLEININRQSVLSSLSDSNCIDKICRAIFPYCVTRFYTEARLSIVKGLSPLTLMPYI